MEFWQPSGGLQMHPLHPAENEPLFRFYFNFWRAMNDRPLKGGAKPFHDETNYSPGHFQAKIPEKGSHFSRDNMWAIYMDRILNGLPIDDLPIFRWNNRTWWHPNGWAVHLALKYTFFKVVFSPLIVLMFCWSYVFDTDEKSSGQCLWGCMNYFLWGFRPSLNVCDEFEVYCTFGGVWSFTSHPILDEVYHYRVTLA